MEILLLQKVHNNCLAIFWGCMEMWRDIYKLFNLQLWLTQKHYWDF